MKQALRNTSINRVVIAAMCGFIVMIGAISAMGVVADRSAERALRSLYTLSAEQLNEINRADALLNAARTNLEVAANQIMVGRIRGAEDNLALALDTLERSEQRLHNFLGSVQSFADETHYLEADASNSGADALVETFQRVLALARQQHEALDQLDTVRFDQVREEIEGVETELSEQMTEFVHQGFARSEALLEEYNRQTTQFVWIGTALLGLSGLTVLLVYLVLKLLILKPLDGAVGHLERIAQADLSVPIDVLGRNEVGRLFAAMRDMQQGLTQVVAEVHASSVTIHAGARDITTSNGELSSRTEQQAAALGETAASMEQLTATVSHNAENSRQASALAMEASTAAEQGGEVVGQVVTTMQGISESSHRIADITRVIDSIAFQTNILALNASVEAARAGEQGRGFAVVAGEVRELASRSAAAAREIKALIDTSVNQVATGAAQAESAGSSMQGMVEAVRHVASIIDEISSASQEQRDGIEQVSQAVGQMDQATQQNAVLVQGAATAAVSLEEQAARLDRAIARFRLAREESDGAARLKRTETSFIEHH